MKFYLPAIGVLIVAAVTAISGIIHGRMTERWGATIDREAIAAELENIPESVGAWELIRREEIGDDARKELACAGYISRTYQNSKTGEQVLVSIILGPPGPMSVHLPEICHTSLAIQPTGKREPVTIEARMPEKSGTKSNKATKEKFWAVNFQATGLEKYKERFFYAWSTGGPWVAPEQSRISFGAYPYLYKIQAAHKLTRGADLKTRDPVEEFLKVFVPAAKCGLVPYADK